MPPEIIILQRTYSYCVSRVGQLAGLDDGDLSMFVRTRPGHSSVHVKISDDHGSCPALKTRPDTLQMHNSTIIVSMAVHMHNGEAVYQYV